MNAWISVSDISVLKPQIDKAPSYFEDGRKVPVTHIEGDTIYVYDFNVDSPYECPLYRTKNLVPKLSALIDSDEAQNYFNRLNGLVGRNILVSELRGTLESFKDQDNSSQGPGYHIFGDVRIATPTQVDVVRVHILAHEFSDYIVGKGYNDIYAKGQPVTEVDLKKPAEHK